MYQLFQMKKIQSENWKENECPINIKNGYEMKWTWNSNSKMEIKVHLKIEKNSPLEQWKLTNGEWKKVDCNSARAN